MGKPPPVGSMTPRVGDWHFDWSAAARFMAATRISRPR